jgi:RNA-directed DNA polymerase
MTTSRHALVARTRLSDLQRTLTDEVASGKGVGLDGLRPADLSNPLDLGWQRAVRLVQERMRRGTYTFTPYREFLVSKGRNRVPRVISIPTVRDRLVLKVLSQVLHDLFGVSGPEIAQRMVGRISVQSPNWDGFVRIDLEDYFGSINHQLLLSSLKRRVRSGAVRRLVSSAIQNPTVPAGPRSALTPASVGIPQGLSISSALAEVFLADLDQDWRERDSVQYFRYVDDILVLCAANEAGTVFNELESQLKGRLLRVHPLGETSKSSTGSMSVGFDFLGYHFASVGTSISAVGMRKIENRIAATFGEFRKMNAHNSRGRLSWLNWKISRLACGVIFEGEHRGWLRFYSRTNDITGLHHLDALVSQLAVRSGVPKTMQMKKFVKAYYVTRSGHASREYIPNPANWTDRVARAHLVDVDGWEQAKVAALHPAELSSAISRVLSRDLTDLERDLDTQS